MKAELRFDDGRTIEIPEEITKRLLKKLYRDDEQLKVDRFRAVKHGFGYLFALMETEAGFDDIWDGKMKTYGSNAKATHYLMRSEVRRIIVGLTRILDEKRAAKTLQ